MLLEELTSENSQPILEDTVVKKGIRKIYYVLNGRNAWHSTWVGQYFNGCMHTNLWSARMRAEDLRNSGSVFYIRELPALVVEGKKQVLVVTQINTDDVLRGYTPTPNRPVLEIHPRINYLHPGANMHRLILTLSPYSNFWHESPLPRTPVMILTSQKKLRDFEKYDRLKVIERHSNSIGTNYFLQWKEGRGLDRSGSLMKLMKIRLKKFTGEEYLTQKISPG